MKKFLSLLLAVMLFSTSFLITSCDAGRNAVEDQVKTDVYDFTEELKSSMNNSENEEAFAKELEKFCDEIGFDAKKVKGSNIVIDVDASTGYENAKSNIFQVEFTKASEKESCQSIAMALATVKNSTNHGNIRMIFSPKVDGVSTGLLELEDSYLEGDNLINLCEWKKTEIFNGAAATNVYKMISGVHMEAPKGTLAYKISISNLLKDDSGDRTSKHTNPIVFLSDLLSSARAGGLNIEIANFTSTGNITDYPTGAEVVVVVDKSTQTKFENRLIKEEEDFEDKNRKRDPDAVFEYDVVEMPQQALNYDHTTAVLSLLYTVKDGVFATTEEDNDGDVLGISTVANISISDSHVEVDILGRTIDEETKTDMDITLDMTAELSDFTVETTERYPLWAPDENNPILIEDGLKMYFEENDIDREVKNIFKENACSIIHEKSNKLNLISIGVNVEETKDCVMSLIDYLQQDKEK